MSDFRASSPRKSFSLSSIALVGAALVVVGLGLFLFRSGDQPIPTPTQVAPTAAPGSAPPAARPPIRPQAEAPAAAPPKDAAEPRAPASAPTSSGPAVAQDDAATIGQLGGLIAKLPLAKLVLDAPKAMTVGEKSQVELRVGVNVPGNELARPNESGNQQVAGQAHVSAEVEAVLDGPAFVVEAKSPKRQSIAEGMVSSWLWDVQAQEPGQRVLTATLYALVANGGAAAPQQVKSYSQPVNVRVKAKTLADWLTEIAGDADKLQSIFVSVGAIVAVVLGWFGYSKMRKEKETKA